MNNNHIAVLKLLLQENTSLTAKTISSKLNVSVRTVKNYIYQINAQYPSTIHSSRDGYATDFKKASQILQKETEKNTKSGIPQNSRERVNYILHRLMSSQTPVNLYDLCEELYISLSTLNHALTLAKRKIQDFNLELKHDSSELSFSGTEANKRKLLSTMVYDSTDMNFADLSLIKKAYPHIDINFVQNSIDEIFNTSHMYINDYSLVNLILHIAIAIDRIKSGYSNQSAIPQLKEDALTQYEIAENLSNKLASKLTLAYTPAEIYELSLLIASRATSIDYTALTKSNIKDYIGAGHYQLVKELIKLIEDNYSIAIDNPEFFVRFSLHVENLLVRAQNKHFCKNPLAEEIKTSCPLIYDISVMMAGLLKEKTGIFINDDEIAFIAFHLGGALEVQKVLHTKIKAVLFCPNYYDINTKLLMNINHRFSDDLLITDILTRESELKNLKNCDLIITTIPFSFLPPIPTLKISILFNQQSQNLLKEKINAIKLLKKKKTFRAYLIELITPEFFEKTNQSFTKLEALRHMSDKLLQHNYVNESHLSDLLEREKLSSTALGAFAIPHALKMNAKKTNISVLITDTPIDWDDKKVNLVLMLCFNIQERAIFHKIFDPLTMILSEPENVKTVYACNTYNEFIDTIVSLLE